MFKKAGLAFSDGDHRTETRKSEDRGGRGVGGGKKKKACSVNSTYTSACRTLSATLSSSSCDQSSTTTWIEI